MAALTSAPPARSSPSSRRRVLTMVVVYATALAFGAALFSGSIPGLAGHATSNVLIDGHEYYSESYFIPLPKLYTNSTPPLPTAFHNVTFWLWTSGWYDPKGSYVHGNGTESNGTTYSFVLGGVASNTSRATLYVSPDSQFAVAWSGQFLMQLMVEIPGD